MRDKTLAIIPARGGSKRFPKKNIALLDGKPLIFHTIDAALPNFDHIIFTSDSEEILSLVLKRYEQEWREGKIEIKERPERLSTDTSKVIETVSYYYNHFNMSIKNEFNQIFLLLPTCPLRTSDDIKKAKEMLEEDVDNVVSVTEFEFPITMALKKMNNWNMRENDPTKPYANNNTRSQDHIPFYRPNGAIYGSWWNAFGVNRNFFKGYVKGFYMPRERSVDVDNEFDLRIAEIILKETRENDKD